MKAEDFERGFEKLKKDFEESEATEPRPKLRRPQPDALLPVEQRSLNSVVTRLPDVRAASSSRVSRKEAEAIRQLLSRILGDLQTGQLITDAEVALAVHVFEKLDLAQRLLLTRYYETDRYDAGNEFMEKAMLRIMALTMASSLATLESFPKKLADRW